MAALRDFVPVTGNTHDLQNRRSEIGSWFLTAAAKVNARIENGHTSQGFYVLAADGTAFGFNNNRSVERVLGFMAEGLKKYRSHPREVGQVKPLAHARLSPPEGASVLRVYQRIHPVPEGCNDSNKNLQRDHLWVLPDEVLALARGEVPESLQLRLCRFTFVDAVRGEPDFWRPGHILVKRFEIDSGLEGRTLVGSFSMQSESQTLTGTIDARLAIASGRITEFKGYVDCTASGSGRWTPGAPEGKFPLKIAIVMAPDTKDTVPPQAAMYGREYLTGR